MIMHSTQGRRARRGGTVREAGAATLPRPGRLAWWVRVAGMLVVLLAASTLRAHPALSTVAVARVTADGEISVVITHDALAFALNDSSVRIQDADMYALLDGPKSELAAALDDGKLRFGKSFQIFADGAPVSIEIVRSPTVQTVAKWRLLNPAQKLPVKAVFEAKGMLPPGTRRFSLKFPRILSDILLQVDRPGVEPVYLPIPPGEAVPEIDIRIAGGQQVESPAGAGHAGEASPRDAAERAEGEREAGSASEGTPSQAVLADPVGIWGVSLRYVRLGFTHIIPDGYDHALFVLGLFLLTPRIKSLLWQITAFTVAHSLTLTLATLKIANIPASIVEPTIALTIAFVAIENMFLSKARPWRAGVAFVFGLVHGLGFASALGEVGLPTGQLAAGLVAFNVGVECGHMAVLAAAFVLLGWARGKPWYRARVAIPISVVIAGISLTWMVQRMLGGG